MHHTTTPANTTTGRLSFHHDEHIDTSGLEPLTFDPDEIDQYIQANMIQGTSDHSLSAQLSAINMPGMFHSKYVHCNILMIFRVRLHSQP